jgi:hypothetical protein
MTPEQRGQLRPYEKFGMSEEEVTRLRIPDKKLKEILANPNTTIHSIKVEENNYGEFLFLLASRGSGDNRTCMTFFGLGYHDYRERWIHKEWFWHQTPKGLVKTEKRLSSDEVENLLDDRIAEIFPDLSQDTQTEKGRMFEYIADLTDDDAAISEMQDLGLL